MAKGNRTIRGRRTTQRNRTPQGRRSQARTAKVHTHPGETVPMRPEVGMQAQFRKKKPPATYRDDSSLSPALDWDGQNGARELGEWLIGLLERAAGLPPPHILPAPAVVVKALT